MSLLFFGGGTYPFAGDTVSIFKASLTGWVSFVGEGTYPFAGDTVSILKASLTGWVSFVGEGTYPFVGDTVSILKASLTEWVYFFFWGGIPPQQGIQSEYSKPRRQCFISKLFHDDKFKFDFSTENDLYTSKYAILISDTEDNSQTSYGFNNTTTVLL